MVIYNNTVLLYSYVYAPVLDSHFSLYIEIEKCPTLNDPDNGKVYVVSDGTVAIFTCDNGFIKTGDSYMQCINGKWTSAPPKCQPS